MTARRPLAALVLSNILGGVGVASGIAVGALLVQSMGGTAMAGVGQALSILGAAVLAVPLANLATRRGRRRALTLGYLVASVGAFVVLAGAWLGWFPLVLLGLIGFGAAQATNLQSRYAASELASPQRRATVMSLVIWATTIGSVLGPNLSGLGGDLGARVRVPELAGPYLFSLAGFVIAGLVVASLYRGPWASGATSGPGLLRALGAPDRGSSSAEAAPAAGQPPTVSAPPGGRPPAMAAPPARRPPAVTAPPAGRPSAVGVLASWYRGLVAAVAVSRNRGRMSASAASATSAARRPQAVGALGALRWANSHRVARFAVLLIVVGHAVMVAVMSMTPVHLGQLGHGLEAIGLVISVHILGMYALSPVVGWLADRFGAMRTALVGLILLGMTAALILVAQSSYALVVAALFLLGVGWSFTMISGSALLARIDSGEVRVPLQGATDALMNYGAAAAAILGGPLLALVGYGGLAVVSGALIVPAAAVGWRARRRRDLAFAASDQR